MLMRFLIIALVGAILTACQGTPEVQTGPDAEVIGDNLHRVDNARVAMGYVDPDADFSRYTAIMIAPLGVNNVEIIPPSGTSRHTGGNNWELTESDKTELQTAFHDAMVKTLSEDGGYTVVNEPGDHVLLIAARLTAIAPTAAKDDFSSRPTGRSRVYTDGAGAMAVAIAFADSETEDVLALAKDSKTGNSTWGVNNSVTNKAEVKRMFTSWALQIRSRLDTIHGKQ